MCKSIARLLIAFALTTICAVPLRAAETTARPKVRAITAFIDIDAANHREQLKDAAGFLGTVRTAVIAAGYEVQTLRVSTQPFPEFTRGLDDDAARALMRSIGREAAALDLIPNLGPAMRGDDDPVAPVDLLIDLLAEPDSPLNANLVVADGAGIHWNAVRQAARVIRALGERSPNGQGNFSFGAIAMVQAYGPFYPGAWHPAGEARTVAIGLESANVVMEVFARERDPRTAAQALSEALAAHARAIEAVATKATAGTGWRYAGIDPTPAPGGDVSIGAAIESFTQQPFGAPGTETAAGIITRAVKDVPVKQTGYSGLMIPVLEESVLTRRWDEGTYGIDSIMAYSAVCAAGLDTVPLPGDTGEEAIARIIGDVATLAHKWNKPLTVRLLPAPGKRAGDITAFGGLLSNARIQPLPGASRQ
jgi:uncharacterized protein (UPF0210 family)